MVRKAPPGIQAAQWRSDAARRAVDILAALLGLVAFGPLMAALAVAVWAESGRPILFSQARLGRGGRLFRLYKFRKFRRKSRDGGMPLTMDHDPRMTGVGGFLARTKLDELPQLWNILVGDMSLVGPRPEVLDFSDLFRGDYRSVLDHKPGIFGPSQTFFRDEAALYRTGRDPIRLYRDTLFPLKARVDLTYFPQRTMVMDLAWVLQGVLAVVGGAALCGVRSDAIEAAGTWIGRHDGATNAKHLAMPENGSRPERSVSWTTEA